MRIHDLKASPRNPRRIKSENRDGLTFSIEEFGDLSGITFNNKLGELVAGHKRIEILEKEYGNLEIDPDSKIRTPNGDEFPVRFVEWDREKHDAAMIAANSRHLQGEFTNDTAELLTNIAQREKGLFEQLRLKELEPGIDYPGRTPSAITRHETEAPPVYTWIVFGIPTIRIGEVQEAIDFLAETDGAMLDMTTVDEIPTAEGTAENGEKDE